MIVEITFKDSYYSYEQTTDQLTFYPIRFASRKSFPASHEPCARPMTAILLCRSWTLSKNPISTCNLRGSPRYNVTNNITPLYHTKGHFGCSTRINNTDIMPDIFSCNKLVHSKTGLLSCLIPSLGAKCRPQAKGLRSRVLISTGVNSLTREMQCEPNLASSLFIYIFIYMHQPWSSCARHWNFGPGK